MQSGDEIRERINTELREAQKQRTTAEESLKTLNQEASANARADERREVIPSPAPELNLERSAEQTLQLSDVIASTFRAFPLIEIARLQAGVASGEQRSAWGAFDTKLEYYSLNQPLGYYETYRNGIGAARNLWWGGYASAGYRIGRGNFEPWYKERETNEAGEFKIALLQPLLQGRAIDPRRVELFQANLRRQAVGPEVQFQLLVATRDAALAYWLWVELGVVLRSQRYLLKLAEDRAVEFDKGFETGVVNGLSVVLNRVEVNSRRMKVNETQMKFRDAPYKLSIFLRDENGAPLIAPPEWLPEDFPEVQSLAFESFDQDYSNALAARPELQLIELQRQEVRWELELARNQTLPNVDFAIEAAQDVGQRASSINDKGPLELESGIVGNVPIQRNKAFGKIQSTNAKLNQLAQKLEFQRNKINAELLQARNQVELTQRNVELARELVKDARQALEFFRQGLTSGGFDLVLLLQQEVRVTEYEVRLLEAERDYFAAIAALQATLGLEPLDQSILLNRGTIKSAAPAIP